MKKKMLMWGLLGLLGLLLACADTSSVSDGGDGGGGSGGGGFTGGGGGSGGGDGSGGTGGGSGGTGGSGSLGPNVFSVALASLVKPTTEGILAPGASAETNKVEGLAVNVSETLAGVAHDDIVADSAQLEVWFTEPMYVDTDGSAKPQTAGGSDNYVFAWDAYVPGADTTSVKSSGATTYHSDEVTIAPAASAKDARRKVQVGPNLLKADDVVLVLLVYQHGKGGAPSLADAVGGPEGLLKHYEFTFSKAPALVLDGVRVSAKAGAGTDQDTMPSSYTALAAVGLTTADDHPLGTGESYGWAKLVLNPVASSSGLLVSFNTFTVSGLAMDKLKWFATGYAKSGDLNTNVSATAAKATTPNRVELTAVTHADFISAPDTRPGKVLLTGFDHYGQQMNILVSLDDGRDS